MTSKHCGLLLAPALLLTLPVACGSGAQQPVPDPTTVPIPAGAVAALQRAAPAGPFAVGRMEVSPGGRAPVWLYYPAAAAQNPPAPDTALPEAYRAGLARRFGAPAAAALIAMPGHATAKAAVATGRFPLLVFSPGANMGGRDYRLLIEALTSQGYVVAVCDPLGAPPAGAERYGEGARDIAQLVPALLGWAHGQPIGAHIDPDRIGLIGHSIGGAAAILALARTPGAVVAVNLDGDFAGDALAQAPARPILYLIGATEGEAEASAARRLNDWATVSAGNPAARILQIDTIRHFDFADAALLPADIIPEARRKNRFGPIGGTRAHAAISALMIGFLDETLRQRQGAFASALRAVPEARPPAR